ncbi:anthranilate synthase family protein [Salinactinospora qingdaonensis]|uniref:anthranilate synthase n=1 Tax=Salinactinospora qingdaonensis TaxID=702744 RepID=A0ABP7FSG2_9ACTN
MPTETSDLLERVLAGTSGGYALLHRSEAGDPARIDVITGNVRHLEELDALPLRSADGDATTVPGHELLALLPYRQIAERGFEAVNDGTPLVAIEVNEQQSVPLPEVMHRLPNTGISVGGGRFDLDDDTYAATARRLIDEEIGSGEGANFVLKRTYIADISDYGPHVALTLFRRLLQGESGAYWTFLVHVPGRTLIGASPERHISLHRGTAVMNPISGTYRYPLNGPSVDSVLRFLEDGKETDELYMVLDEELKMMARFCELGGRVFGPYLKEMAKLAHTEYFIEGRSREDVREILRETMYAPTVTGSPVESASRIISRYEPEGRGYYSGAVALVGRDGEGERTLDSAILIRTADISNDGELRIGVGSTIVRHSDPASEAEETRVKAAGLRSALTDEPAGALSNDVEVRAALERRNSHLAGYWLGKHSDATPLPDLAGRSVLVIDAEDTFTSMIAAQLTSLGLLVEVRRFDEPYTLDGSDLVVMGPGPGDPLQTQDPKIARLRSSLTELLKSTRPFLAVCLSHQVLCGLIDLPVIRREVPNQGLQKRIDLFGKAERVGFYNTFSARSKEDKVELPGVGAIEVCRDPENGEVHALRGPGFASAQFHAESILTENGPVILGDLLSGTIRR